MQYEQFLSSLRAALQARLEPETQILFHKVYKNNQVCRDSLIILPPGQNASPVIYLHSYYQDFQAGMSLEEIAEAILAVWEQSRPTRPVNPEQLFQYGRIRHQIIYRLVHYASNRPMLENAPFLPFLDLAIVFYILLDSRPHTEVTALVTNDYLKLWQVTAENLMEAASANTPVLYRCRCLSLEQMAGEMFREAGKLAPELSAGGSSGIIQPPLSENPSPLPMYILTNHKGCNGAACILYDHILEEFSRQAGGNFFILPSSIHEMILVPHLDFLDGASLEAMVRDVNQSHVQPCERLSDHVYYYTAETGELTVCGYEG